jgi:hypothetical protein
VRADRSAAVRGALDVDDHSRVGDVQLPARVGELVDVRFQSRRYPIAADRERALLAAQHRVRFQRAFERALHAEDLADAIQSDRRRQMQVVHTVGQRIEAALNENAQVRAAIERDRAEIEHAR